MNTLLNSALVVLIAKKKKKRIPIYGFYNMPTCISVLLMAIFSLAGLFTNLSLNSYTFVFGGFLLIALICCYGVKSPCLQKVKF